MATRFSYDKSDVKAIRSIMELYLSKSRAQLATDILLAMYAFYNEHGDNIFIRQYILLRELKDVPKSNIQEILKDLLRIRAIRNMGAKGTVSSYKPSLNELSTALRQHSEILKRIHGSLLEDHTSYQKEAVHLRLEDEKDRT